MHDAPFQRRVETIFDEARGLPPEARESYVRDACDGDESLIHEVLGLLRHDASAGGGFLASPVLGERRVSFDEAALHESHTIDPSSDAISAVGHPSESGANADGGEDLPKRLGDYTILGLLGKGGMGVVYHAQQATPRRDVAIKVMRPEQMSADQIRRFEHEAEFLGRLQHPGIAMIHEAGVFDTDSGPQAFLAMELVADAVPITEYATTNSLGVSERLLLVAMVCDAIEHAHQHGIMHRDLKPANILVDPTGQPKVLDFGVARATDSDLGLTLVDSHIGPLIGTVPYMSPEQAAGDRRDIDTRSDVYALGVVMYELLVGRLPYRLDGKMIHEAVRIIREVEPTPLSSIDRALRGDVDTIMAMALEKDKSRRYASAHDLASDIRRYLEDEPISARAPNTWYLFGKFAKRHRALVAAIIVIALSLCAATTISVGFALSAAEQRRIAVREREISDAVNDFLNQDLLAAVAPSAEAGRGKDVLMREVLDAAAARIDAATQPGGRLADKPLVESAIRATLGDTYVDLGLFEAAEPHLKRGLVLDTETLGEMHPETLTSLDALAMLYLNMGNFDEARPLLEDALRYRHETLGAEHPDTLTSMNNLALLFNDIGELDRAEPLLVETLEISRRTLGAHDLDTLVSMNNLATFYMHQGKYAEAEDLLVQVVNVSKRLLGEEHPETLVSISNLGAMLSGQGRYAAAAEVFGEALADCRRILGDDHPDTLTTISSLASLRLEEGRHDLAAALNLEAMTARRSTLGPEHPDTLTSMNNLGLAYVEQERYDEAEQVLLETLAIRRRVLGPEHPSTLSTLNNVAYVFARQGRSDAAIERWEETLALRLEVLGRSHPKTLVTMDNLAQIYMEADQFGDAEYMLSELVTIRSQMLGEADLTTLEARASLCEIYILTHRYEEAVTDLTRVVDLSKGVLGEEHWLVSERMLHLGEALVALERFEDAEPVVLKAHRIAFDEFGPADVSTQHAVKMLVQIYEAQGPPDQAAAWQQHLLETEIVDDVEPADR